MVLAESIGLVRELRDALQGEVEDARTERQALKSFDPELIFERAGRREAFNARASSQQEKIVDALRSDARRLGLSEMSLAKLTTMAPAEAEALSQLLAEIRELAASLHEIDALNRRLAQRALSCVRGYLTTVAPPSTAYDRRGLAPAAVADSGSLSRRA